MLDKGQGLHGFAKAHFVGQNAAKPVFRKEIEVRKALNLITAQVGIEPLGRSDGPHLAERADFFAQVVPERVCGRAGQVFEQTVEHRGFKLLELLLWGLGGVEPKGRELVRKLFEPFFGQAGVRAVFQLHIAFAACPGLPYFFQGQALAFVLHIDVERKPLFLFVAHNLRRDVGRSRAYLVAREGFFAIDAVGFDQLGVRIEQKGNGFFRLEEPQLA